MIITLTDKRLGSGIIKNKGYKIPIMVYVYPDLFIKIEDARGLAKRSTYIEVALDDLFKSTGGD